MRIRQLQSDVREDEEAELRRLEHRSPGDGEVDAGGGALTVAPPVQAEPGTVVSGAVQRSEQVSQKLFPSGGFRESAKIKKLLPRGSAGLKAKVPKRKDYGAEGEEGDLAHAQAMIKISKNQRSCVEVGVDALTRWITAHCHGRGVERNRGTVGQDSA